MLDRATSLKITEKKWVLSIFITALAWSAIYLIFSFLNIYYTNSKEFLLLWMLCTLNIFVLTKLVCISILHVENPEQKKIKSVKRGLIFWLMLKLLSVFSLFVVIIFTDDWESTFSLLFGLGTIVFVPLVSGFYVKH